MRLRGTAARQLAIAAALIVVGALVDLYLIAPDRYYVNVALQMMLFVLLAQGLNWIAGYGGRLAFGNVLFFGIGGYAVEVGVAHGLYPPIVGIAIATAISAGLAFALNYALWKLDGLLFALVTFSLSLMLQVVFTITPYVGQADGLSEPLSSDYSLVRLTLGSPNDYLIFGAALVLVVTLLTRWAEETPFGRQVLAVKDDRVAAATSGVDVRLLTGLVWAASAALTALVGVYYAQYNLFVEPVSAFGVTTSVQMLFPAVIGGFGQAWGPLVGGAIIPAARLLNELAGPGRLPGLNVLVYGCLLVIVVRLVPGGLLSLLPTKRQARRLAAPQIPAVIPSTLLRAVEPVRVKKTDEPTRAPLVEVVDVTKSFGGLLALSHVDLDVGAGELVGLVGPNGAGKTTLFNCLTGVSPVSSGTIRIGGSDVTRMQPHGIARRGVARTYQAIRMFPSLTVREHALIPLAARGLHDPMRILDALRAVGLEERADDLVVDFSAVDCRKVELARAIVAGTRLVLLDEAMVGLTDVEAQHMAGLIREVREGLGVAFIVVEHVMDRIVGLVDRVVVMDHGTVLAVGEPNAVLNSSAVLEAYFGLEAAHA